MIAPRLSRALAEYHAEAALWGRDLARNRYAAALMLTDSRPWQRQRRLVHEHGVTLLPALGAVAVERDEIFRGPGREAWRIYSRTLRLLRSAERAVARAFPRGIDHCAGCGALVTDGTDICDECYVHLTEIDYCPQRGAR